MIAQWWIGQVLVIFVAIALYAEYNAAVGVAAAYLLVLLIDIRMLLAEREK